VARLQRQAAEGGRCLGAAAALLRDWEPRARDPRLARSEAGARTPAARSVHVCFGEGDNLQIFDVWESQEEFDKFGETLMPILAERGINPGEPMAAPVHSIISP